MRDRTIRLYFPALLVALGLLASQEARTQTFTSAGLDSTLSGIAAYAVDWGDYDADGRLDILVAGKDGAEQAVTRIFRQDTDSTFADIGAGLLGLVNASVAWGDYDNDGDLDVLLAGTEEVMDPPSSTPRAAIYRNDAGIFTDIAAGLVGATNGSVAWGDYDNDGDLDALVTGEDISLNATATVYRNDGGAFTDAAAGLDGASTSDAAWGDYDNDGDLDILLAGWGTSGPFSRVYANTAGVFGDTGAGLEGFGNASVAWGDYDSDGDLDILIAGTNGAFTSDARIYRNDAGLFADIAAGLTGVSDGGAAWGDCDNDGDLDALLTGYTGSSTIATIYRNDAGSFVDIGAGLTGCSPGDVAWGDTDGDGDLDFLLGGFDGLGNKTLGLYRNLALTANTPPGAPANLSAVSEGLAVTFSWDAATDFEMPDSALTYNLRVGTTPGGSEVVPGMAIPGTGERLVQRFGNAGRRFSWTLNLLSGSDLYWSVQAIDACFAGSPFAAEQQFTPVYAFEDAEAGLVGAGYACVAWGDYDFDGDLDLVVAGNSAGSPVTKLYRNDAGVFVDTGASLADVAASACAWGDYDNDGDLDLVLAGADNLYTAIARIYRNDAGSFTDIGAGLTGVTDGAAAWGDYDNDGDLDLLLSGYAVGGRIARVYSNAAGVFTDIGAGLTGMDTGAAAWGDYDSDGDLDILLTGWDAVGPASAIYRNDGGSFTDIGAGLAGFGTSDAAWGDYDNDGDLDVLAAGTDPAYAVITRIYRNDAGVFMDAGAGLPGATAAAVAWGDYDSDGDLDVFLCGQDSSSVNIARVYRNDAGLFTDIDVGGGLVAVWGGAAEWGDYDNDGDPDLLVAGNIDFSTTATRIYRNLSSASNTPPSSPTNLSAQTVGNVITFTWDPASDAETAVAGLTYNLMVGSTPAGSEFISAMADPAMGWKLLPGPGNAQHNTEWTLNLDYDSPIYWSVQAVDAAGAGSAFAPQSVLGTLGFEDVGALLEGVSDPSLAWGDYDGDNDLDLLLSGLGAGAVATTQLYRNDAGTFTAVADGLVDVGYSGSAWGDYDNDGDLDILMAGQDSLGFRVAAIYRNDAGIFTDIGAGLWGMSDCTCTWADYDNDGDLDAFVSGATAPSYYVEALYRNDGGVFTSLLNTGLQVTPGNLAYWGDYDNDGDLDLLGGNWVSTNDAGTFTNASYDSDLLSGSSAWGDYDNDGDLDIVVSGDPYQEPGFLPETRIYRNDAGVFTNIGAVLPGLGSSVCAWADLDNDGDRDILVAGTDSSYAPSTLIFVNEGGGSFVQQDMGLADLENPALAPGDFDDDGKIDLAMAGTDSAGAPSSFLYKNHRVPVNAVPLAPTGLAVDIVGGEATFSWSAGTDAETPAAGLTYNLRAGTTPGGSDIVSAMSGSAMGFRRVVDHGNAGHNLSWTVTVPVAMTYYWSVQAIDASFAGSPFAAEIELPHSAWTILPTGVPYGQPQASWADFDGDGDLDVYLSGSNAGVQDRLLANGGGPGWTLTDVTAAPLDSTAATTGGIWGDYDNDGDVDLFVGGRSGATCKLYRNDGAGAFTDVTSPPLSGAFDLSMMNWVDYDGDGLLDLYLVEKGAVIGHVFRGNGDGTFTEADLLPVFELVYGYAQSVAWGDYDGDGDLDAYLTATWTDNTLVVNSGNGVFNTVASTPLLNSAYVSWDADWGDYDNDGDMDLVVANDGGNNKLFRNDGGGTFTDVSMGLPALPGDPYHVSWVDYDNDGDLDLIFEVAGVPGAGDALFRNQGDGTFLLDTGLPDGSSFRTGACGDYDNDGDLDFFAASQSTADAAIWRNDWTPGNHWLHVDLSGVASNRQGIGARLELRAGGRKQLRYVDPPGRFGYQNSTTVEFGLGAETLVESLVIHWPSGAVQLLTDIPADQRIEVQEGGTVGGPGGEQGVPKALALHQSFPNPFASSATIRFDLPREMGVRIDVFELTGRHVRTLVASEGMGPGGMEVTWDGQDGFGRRVAAGLYLCRLKVGGRSRTMRMMVVR